MKKYNQSPLPFQGQKRRFLNEFREGLSNFPSDTVYVDLFGGSGLLSHTVKQMYPEARVVWNDYDNFSQRLQHVAKTNRLIAKIRQLVAGCEKDKKLPAHVRAAILREIALEDGYVDYVTVSSSILFSGKYARDFAELSKHTFYNVVKQSDYEAEGYLEGVEVVREDYQELYQKYKSQGAVFLFDPPYLGTDSSSYSSGEYWKLTDYLDILSCLTDSYFYFTSNKSSVVELCEWMSSQSNYENPFAGATTKTTTGTVNYSASYTDIMVYKIIENE